MDVESNTELRNIWNADYSNLIWIAPSSILGPSVDGDARYRFDQI
jgi:hypothetical protein